MFLGGKNSTVLSAQQPDVMTSSCCSYDVKLMWMRCAASVTLIASRASPDSTRPARVIRCDVLAYVRACLCVYLLFGVISLVRDCFIIICGCLPANPPNVSCYMPTNVWLNTDVTRNRHAHVTLTSRHAHAAQHLRSFSLARFLHFSL